MAPPVVHLGHLDNLWFQVTGSSCNIACTHCFNRSGPGVSSFGHLDLASVQDAIQAAVPRGVREVFFTGGEPFLHPALLDMMELSLVSAPTTVLTNGTLISERMADRLAVLSARSRYSLEIRVSLDGSTEETNDAIRGAGVFRHALAATARLHRRGLLPLVTVVRTWPEADELAAIEGFVRVLRSSGYGRPRLKILPALPLGRELERNPAVSALTTLLTEQMLEGFDRDLLMCSNSRLVTDRGVWVCPLLVEYPDARLGSTLDAAAEAYPLRHPVCVTCWRYGTICSNVSSRIDGSDLSQTPLPRQGS
jgi:MoaA/NifB/PqqE/SkfB family radical SAM enzyme